MPMFKVKKWLFFIRFCMQERNWNKWKPRIFFKLNDNLWKGVLRVSHSSEKVFTLPPSPCNFIGFVTTQRVLWMPWTNKLFSHFFLTILTLLPILLCNRLLFCIFIYTCLFFSSPIACSWFFFSLSLLFSFFFFFIFPSSSYSFPSSSSLSPSLFPLNHQY